MYIWERPQWPELTWDGRRLSALLSRVSREQGRLLGKMEGLGFALRNEVHLRTLTEDVVKSSEIEGEKLDSAQVRSSIARIAATTSRFGKIAELAIPASRRRPRP